jgi:hypothetical protein
VDLNGRNDFDIALLEMETPLDLNDHDLYGTICLPEKGKFYDYTDETTLLAGWGK